VLEFGVQVPRWNPAEPVSDQAPLRIGSVGRLVEVKGQRHLIEAVAAVRHQRPLEVHLYGDGPDRASLQDCAAAYIPGRAFFHGNVIDRARIYAGMDILVVASRMEGLSLAIMEAMARAVVVIATDVGSNSRLVCDGHTGLLVPYGDVGAMTAALEAAITDAPLRHRLATAAREHIVRDFSLQTAAARLAELYGFATTVRQSIR
jgi:glycogen(starch) synthase